MKTAITQGRCLYMSEDFAVVTVKGSTMLFLRNGNRNRSDINRVAAMCGMSTAGRLQKTDSLPYYILKQEAR